MVKSSKKALAVLLAVACLITFMPAMASQSFAAKKLTVKPAKKTIYVKKSVTLKANQKVKWSASKASLKVVKLTSKKAKSIKVTGKKAGKAVVTAKVGKQTKKVTITVKKAKAAVKKTAVTAVAISADNAGDPAPKVGDTLTAQLKDKDGNVVKADATYQWYRTGKGGTDRTKITGATSASYTVANIDYGCVLFVEATVDGKTYVAPETGMVDRIDVTKVVVTGMSEKTGNSKVNNVPVVGDTLKAEAQQADGTPVTTGVSYKWYRGGAEIIGANKAEYTLTADDLGYVITVKVSETSRVDGVIIADTTLTTTGVQAGATVVKTSISSATVTLAPTAPEVGGTAVKATAKYNGKDVTIGQNGWVMTYYIGEVKAGKGVAGTSYQAQTTDLGKKIIFVLTNTQDKYVGSAQAETSPVTIGLKSATITADTKTLAAGSTLTVTDIKDQKDQAVKVNTTNATYQWYRGSKAISGATGTSYTLTAEDETAQAVAYKCIVTGAGNYGGTVDSNLITESVAATQEIASAIIVKGTATTAASTAAVGDTLNIVTTPAAAKDAVDVTWYAKSKNNSNDKVYQAVGTGTSYTVKAGDRYVKATVAYVDKTGDAWAASTNITQPTEVQIADKLGAVTFVYNNEQSTTKAATYTSTEAEVGLYVHATVANAPAGVTVKYYKDAACTTEISSLTKIEDSLYNDTALTDHTVYAKAVYTGNEGTYTDSDVVAIKLVPSKTTIKSIAFTQPVGANNAWETVTSIDPAKNLGIDVVVADPAGNETTLSLAQLRAAGYTVVFASETETFTNNGTSVAGGTFKANDKITVTVTPDGVNCSGSAATKDATALAK